MINRLKWQNRIESSAIYTKKLIFLKWKCFVEWKHLPTWHHLQHKKRRKRYPYNLVFNTIITCKGQNRGDKAITLYHIEDPRRIIFFRYSINLISIWENVISSYSQDACSLLGLTLSSISMSTARNFSNYDFTSVLMRHSTICSWKYSYLSTKYLLRVT